MTLRTVAALYVDPLGPYPGMLGVECWGRPAELPRQTSLLHWDARCYLGPHPVVAHPPCGTWSRSLRQLYEVDDGDCAVRAVEQVRAYGGVLEHPAGSKLWGVEFPFGKLPPPGGAPDAVGGYTITVNQCDWGHVCRKATWLYFVRVPRDLIVLPAPGKPTHWASGSRGPSKTRKGSPVPPGVKVASAQQRRRTPPAFAADLVGWARAATESAVLCG